MIIISNISSLKRMMISSTSTCTCAMIVDILFASIAPKYVTGNMMSLMMATKRVTVVVQLQTKKIFYLRIVRYVVIEKRYKI